MQKDVQYYSELQRQRLQYNPPLPPILNGNFTVASGGQVQNASDDPAIREQFSNTFKNETIKFVPTDTPIDTSSPIKIGVVLSGGQAPGGHNVITGIFDYLKKDNPNNKLYGFVGGPKGIFTNKTIELTAENVFPYRNQGGFDIIGSGRDKIESPEQFANSLATARALGLNGLIVIGGDDSNTNAAVLAEYFQANGSKDGTEATPCVIGVPKTIDGDLKGTYIETSFGFDSACKVYSEQIGNIAIDSESSKKYYHFIRLMGRAASHITLECALQTHPNIAFIGEEVAQQKKSLHVLVDELVDVIVKRAERGKNFGVVLVPEGLIDFIPEIHHLIAELNDITARMEKPTPEEVSKQLSEHSREVFDFLPDVIRGQMLLDRDSHGNVQLSKIETESLLVSLVTRQLAELKAAGKYRGSFAALTHFLGYEGRCSLPSNFDCDYCYCLGYTAAALIRHKQTGLMACARNLRAPVSEWRDIGGVPITSMLNMEKRKGRFVPVIKKALVELDSKPFAAFVAGRDQWALEDCYSNPGPIQYAGRAADARTHVLTLDTSA